MTVAKRNKYEFPVGSVMFTQTDDSIISIGISNITDDEFKQETFRPSHVLVVTGTNRGVEAHLQGGTRACKLDKYIDDPHCRVIVRALTSKMANRGNEMRYAAYRLTGKGYDRLLILGLFFKNTFGKFFPKKFVDWVVRKSDAVDRYICSELVITAGNRSRVFKPKEDPRQSPMRFFYESPNLGPVLADLLSGSNG